jgi:RNA polymerase sigma-70 factor (ECF subfamily)
VGWRIGSSRQTREQAFQQEALIHLSSLLRAGLRLTSNLAAAEDLAQETLMRAWRSWEQYTPGTNCRAWLFRIMMNVYNRSWTRTNALPVTLSLDDCTESEMPVTRPNATMYLRSEILMALNGLREDQRVVLVLASVEGFRCREIAEILSIPIGTVMSRLSRARTEMQKVLTDGRPKAPQQRAVSTSVDRRRIQ